MRQKWWKQPRSQAFKAYAIRDAILLELGFASYRAYLQSELWASIRERVLNRDGMRCQCCGKKASQVHHHRYTREVLLGEAIDDLRSICGGCHRSSEIGEYGKVPLKEANKRQKRRLKRVAKDQVWHTNAEYRRLWRLRKELLLQPRAEVREELAAATKQMRLIVKQQSVIVRTPTYVTDDATLFVGQSTSRRQTMVSVPTGRHQPIPA